MNPRFVPSLELCKQLKEAGWKKETEFWWVHNKIRDVWEIKYGLSECIKEHQESWEHCSAPLSDEILEQLPHHIKCWKASNYYWVDNGTENQSCHTADALPDALAKMWLYLKKEGDIK